MNNFTQTPENMLEVAINIVRELGFPVFPCRETLKNARVRKSPYISGGYKSASRDEKQIRDWWYKFPNALVGVPTGRETGIFIIDIDIGDNKDGEASFAKLFDGDPNTCQTITPSGGRHIIFQYPQELEYTISADKRFGEGIDIRNDGGYVIWAGSNTVKGDYRFKEGHSPQEVGFTPIPPKLLTALKSQKNKKNGQELFSQHLIPEGTRDDTLFRAAVNLSNKGVSENLVRQTLSDMNKRCSPPLDYDQLEKINKSANGYRATAHVALTDLGNGERFVRDHLNEVIYCSDQKTWYTWNGKYWEKNDTKISQKAKMTARNMLVEAADFPEISDSLRKWQKSSESIQRQLAMITAAQSHPDISKQTDDLNYSTELFNTKNGTLDLKKASFKEHERTDYLTKISNANYHFGSDCPRWKKFISEICCQNEKLQDYLQILCGYLLTGERNEQAIVYLLGDGANGKSVFLEILSHIFGDYAGVISAKAFIARGVGGIPNDIAGLLGKRLVTLSEFPENAELNTTVIKSITGGDKIAARHLYKDYFEFKPQFQLICAMNALPNVDNSDEAYFRRVHIVPFNMNLQPEQIDKKLTKNLLAEADGILGWCFEGYKKYLKLGLNQPELMVHELKQYKQKSNPVDQFVHDCVVRSNEDMFYQLEDFTHYVSDYCEREDLEYPGSKKMKKRLRELLGPPCQRRIEGKPIRGYASIKIIVPDDQYVPF